MFHQFYKYHTVRPQVTGVSMDLKLKTKIEASIYSITTHDLMHYDHDACQITYHRHAVRCTQQDRLCTVHVQVITCTNTHARQSVITWEKLRNYRFHLQKWDSEGHTQTNFICHRSREWIQQIRLTSHAPNKQNKTGNWRHVPKFTLLQFKVPLT